MQSSRRALLIVEHDDPTRDLYVRALCQDYCVFACSDDQDALDLLRLHEICAVVLEPALPGGWALLAAIRQATPAPGPPIILCSTLDERKRGFDLGATVYLVKPVLPTQLLAAVQQVIDHAGYHQYDRRAQNQFPGDPRSQQSQDPLFS